MTGEMSHCGLDIDDSCFDGVETSNITIIATHSLIVYYVYKSLKQS